MTEDTDAVTTAVTKMGLNEALGSDQWTKQSDISGPTTSHREYLDAARVDDGTVHEVKLGLMVRETPLAQGLRT
jgi:hypothetical protein